jgi:hypothetical protein
MYEYRILFPRVGTLEIRRELAQGPATERGRRADDRQRRAAGCVQPEKPVRKERS